MWNFRKDVLSSYLGHKFDMRWEDILNLFHIYSKERGKKMKVTKEIEEYSNKPLEESFKEKIKDNIIIVTKLLQLDYNK